MSVRPACLLEWVDGVRSQTHDGAMTHYGSRYLAVDALYRAEWAKRGFKRSP